MIFCLTPTDSFSILRANFKEPREKAGDIQIPGFFFEIISKGDYNTMKCTTVRKGTECPFMTAKGCSYNGGSCHEAVEACKGCARTVEMESGWYCMAAPEPSLKWKSGICNMATHVKASTITTQAKINPLKASKRASKKK